MPTVDLIDPSVKNRSELVVPVGGGGLTYRENKNSFQREGKVE
jgi:hypothetical protein